ncbi:MAG: DUF692 family protein [Leptolinea sp.]|nr:DUF692 family protein [Leptolinea sp.]
MKLAVNYSPQAGELLQSGQIEFDLFKTPNWKDMVAEAQKYLPVYVHFDLNTANGKLNDVNWQEVDEFLSMTGTSMINLHVVAPLDLDPCNQAQVERVLDGIVKDVTSVCNRYGPERVITENVPYTKNGKEYLQPVSLPAFFQRLSVETGCGMLLDLAHAAITARSLKTDPEAFFSEFPVKRLKEIHITGLGMHDGEIHDHMKMQDRDWTLFESAIDRIRFGEWRSPEIIAFEYGGTGAPFIWRSESDVLLEQVPRLRYLVHNGNGKNSPG